MKLKFAIIAIIGSTIGIIALIFNFINNSTMPLKGTNNNDDKNIVSAKIVTDSPGLQQVVKKTEPLADQEAAVEEQDDIFDDEDNEYEEDDEEEGDESEPLSDEDIKIIEKISSLSAHDLDTELNSLKQRIEKDDVIAQLESGELDAQKTLEAKALLERLALLSMENTRRTYQSTEPELKNPLVAHRESLKEIREMLSEY